MTPRLAALLLALAALAATLPTALASEHDEEEEELEREEDAPREDEHEAVERDEEAEDEEDDKDEEWEDDERELALRTTDEGFEYESRRESALGKDEIRVRFDADDARFRFEYRTESEDNDTQLKFRVDFTSLIEHDDPDADGAYDVGETVHRKTSLKDLTPGIVAGRNGSIETIDVTYALPDGGVLTLRFHVTPTPTNMGEVRLAPTEAKYDVLIRDYAWNANTSRLALETRTRTTIEADYDEADEGQPGLEFGSGQIAGFHRWLNTTQVDGRTEPVGATVLAEKTTQQEDEFESESVVVFSYAHGASITHDPSLGVERLKQIVGEVIETIRGDWRVFGLAAAATAGIVAATAIPRMRRRG